MSGPLYGPGCSPEGPHSGTYEKDRDGDAKHVLQKETALVTDQGV